MKLGFKINKKQRSGIIIGVAILLILLFVGGLGTQSSLLLPTFEGPNADIFGFQPCGSSQVFATATGTGANNLWLVPANGPLGATSPQTAFTCPNQADTPSTYSWNYAPAYTSVTICSAGTNLFGQKACETLEVKTQIEPAIQALSSNNIVQTLSYTIKNPYSVNNINNVQVQGQVTLYNVQISLTIQQGGSYPSSWGFHNDQIWFRFYSTTWNNYILANNPSPQNNTQAGAWSAPILFNFVGSPGEQGSGSPTNDATSPDWHSAPGVLNLYSLPQVTGTIPSQEPQSVQNALISGGSPYSPETQLTQVAYFPITLVNFGDSSCGPGCDASPQILMNFQLYELQIGSYLWGNPLRTAQTITQNQCSGSAGGICNVGNAFTSLFNNPLTYIFIGVLVVAVAFVFSLRIPQIKLGRH